ncbi:YbfB/YjiJ family MFS transporter [Hydrogenophaga sp. OTU3427]|uniref:YbfB/YjiJ family MFS transporter n=1 Tax=Hydrogenophaga sp. OTU3427 TaxID=3043856 RepID=UPI00313D6AA2
MNTPLTPHAGTVAPAPAWDGLSLALRLALAPLVALGFSRFAYALLLPGMQQSLGWSLSQAGALNTANGIGYLLGALLASPLAARWGTRRCFTLSLWLSALSLLACALPTGWHLFLGVRVLGGWATACAFVLGTALAARAMPQRPAAALAVYFAGSGLGMVIAGASLPHWLLSPEPEAWRSAWTVMGGLAGVAAWLAMRAALRLPGSPHTAASAGTPSRLQGLAPIAPTLLANALYGAGYVGYTTFVVALLRQQGLGTWAAALFFCGLGLASMAASPGWGGWLGRQRGGRGFAVVALCVAAGTVPVLLSAALPALVLSALLFGASFMAGPAAVSVTAQRALPAPVLASGLGALTAAFSLGQSIGPLLTGWVADAAGTLEAGLWTGPVLLALGAAVALRQR